MNKLKKYWSKVPGWVVMLTLVGGLYATGLHIPVMGFLQRLVLATGLMKPQVPTLPEAAGSAPAKAAQPGFPLADYNLVMRNLQGQTLSMDSLKGKVIFLNLWATWCPPCLAEMPGIQDLYEKMPSDQIAFVMLSLDEDPAKAKKFVDRKGYTFPVYTPAGQLPSGYRAGNVIPTTFVISPEGKVVVQKSGMADYDTKEFRAFMLQLARTAKN
ncbi:MAG: TlpA family protein disulfide reductase [Adhaeribacter sp.]